MDEEAWQIKANELVVEASSSRLVDVERSTYEGVVICADTTDGVPTSEGVRSKKSDPPAC